MYKSIIRPLLFLLSPELIHKLIVFLVGIFFRFPGIKALIRQIYHYKKSSSVRVAGIQFPSRVGLAAGFDKNAEFFNEFSAFGFGFIEIGTLTPKAQPGNPKPRSFRLPKDKALINRMGFNNIGVDAAVENLKKRSGKLIIGGNIGKNTLTPNDRAVDDYAYCFEKLYDYVDYFVVNVSCPNISDLKELQDQDMLELILTKITQIRQTKPVSKPVFLKISPDLNLAQLDSSLEIVNKTGLDGIVATNTSVSREGLNTSYSRVKKIGQGGLSGKPLADRSTDLIRYIRQKAGDSLPIIGVGGIFTASDAAQKIEAGANLVQVYTGFIYEGPAVVKRISKAIDN